MTRRASDRPLVPVAFAVAAALILLLPGILGPYTYFIDELYYVSCSERLAWGYVDHPPLAPALLRLSRVLLGDGLLALRLPAALAGALAVAMSGLLARRLDGGRWAQALACASVLTGPVYLVMFGFFSMNAFEILLWTACGWLLVEIEARREPRLWVAFGLLAGLGLMNKHTMVLLALALGAGLLLTPARRHLASRWLWIGALLAGVLFLPNLLWQVENAWPSLEFYRNAAVLKNVHVPPWEVLFQQILFVGPGTLPVWIAGLVFLWRRREGAGLQEGAGLRHLAILYLALLAMAMAGGQSRPDRIAGFYPVLFAAGAVGLESWAASRAGRWPRIAVPAWVGVWALALAPLGSPLLPPAAAARYATGLRVVPQIERGEGKRTQLPQWFADRLGWEQLADDVAAARAMLPAAERQRVVYIAPSYGQAGALEWLGRDRGLRPVHCTHNNWFLWGPPPDPVEVAILLGNNRETLERAFEEVELAGVHDCGYCMPWRDEMPIWIVRGAKFRFADRWEDWRHFE